MNEEELRAIWQKNENLSLENFDFAAVTQKAVQSQQKLRRKMRWEFVYGILILLFNIFFFFRFPQLLLILPILIAAWIWVHWETKRIYQLESEDFANLKEFLQKKEKFIHGYIKRTRLLYLLLPFIFTLAFAFIVPVKNLFSNPLGLLLLIIIAQTATMVAVEINLRLVYVKPLDETRDLLRQLDETQ